jgi:two-component system KDP operon response regulator KdpE
VTLASRAIVVIEDEPQLRRVLRALLEAEQYRVIEAEDAAHGMRAARLHKPDLIILDLGLPDRDGMDVIPAVREWSTVPIIVLSARTAEADKVAALEAGADDYVTKPFAPREFGARLQVALRHAAHVREGGNVITIGAWRIDLAARTALAADGQSVHLTPTEYRLLEILAQHIGFVVTHQQMLRYVWGPASVEQTQYLRVYLKQLRQKLEPEPNRPQWLLTETGVGYRLAPA